MARLLTLVLLVASCSSPADGPPQPAQEPPQAWQRLRAALFVRSAPDERVYGEDELDPLLYPASSYLFVEPRLSEELGALDALLAAPDACAQLRPLERALLQRELWSVFDWLVGHPAPAAELESRLARLLRALALDARELRELPAPPDRAGGTPAGLLTAEQGWVRLGDARGRLVTPSHLAFAGGRSHFEVLLRLPEGREATIAYLAQLRAATAELPQFPVGTSVALVRRLVLVDRRAELVLTPLVESVQLRTYLAIAAPTGQEIFSFDISKEQQVAEFEFSRRLLFAGRDGGLRRVGDDDPSLSSFGTHGEDPFEEAGDARHWVPRTLQRCGGCHGQAGVYGLSSYTRVIGGPGTISGLLAGRDLTVPVEGDARQQAEATLSFKRGSDSWKALVQLWGTMAR